MKAFFHEGLALELEFPWLPRLRTNVDALDKKPNDQSDHVLRRLSGFYATGTFLITAGFLASLATTLRSEGICNWGKITVGVGLLPVILLGLLLRSTLRAPVLKSIAVHPLDPFVPAASTKQLRAVGKYDDGSIRDLTTACAWQSLNQAVATVSDNVGSKGLASGIAAGTSSITATLNNIRGETTLQVAALTRFLVDPQLPTITVGATQQFKFIATYDDGSVKDLTAACTWSSSNQAAADVSNDPASKGLATGRSRGTSDIKATFMCVTNSGTLTVA